MATIDYIKTVKAKIEVKNCPFCGSTQLKYIGDSEYGKPPVERVICEQCRTRGPIATEQEDAFSRWNSRVTEEDTKELWSVVLNGINDNLENGSFKIIIATYESQKVAQEVLATIKETYKYADSKAEYYPYGIAKNCIYWNYGIEKICVNKFQIPVEFQNPDPQQN